MPRAGYFSFAAGVSAITQYITGYYNRYRPHQHNGGLSPLATEAEYKKTYNGLAMFSSQLSAKSRHLGLVKFRLNRRLKQTSCNAEIFY